MSCSASSSITRPGPCKPRRHYRRGPQARTIHEHRHRLRHRHPHATTDCIPQAVAALGRSNEASLRCPGRPPVHLVVLFLVPSGPVPAASSHHGRNRQAPPATPTVGEPWNRLPTPRDTPHYPGSGGRRSSHQMKSISSFDLFSFCSRGVHCRQRLPQEGEETSVLRTSNARATPNIPEKSPLRRS